MGGRRTVAPYAKLPRFQPRELSPRGTLSNNPRLSGLKLGAAIYKELVKLKFLDLRNTSAIGRCEGMLRFISGRNGVSSAEIRTYFE
jgi:hypothetical protein